jgi:hypothetical protein
MVLSSTFSTLSMTGSAGHVSPTTYISSSVKRKSLSLELVQASYNNWVRSQKLLEQEMVRQGKSQVRSVVLIQSGFSVNDFAPNYFTSEREFFSLTWSFLEHDNVCLDKDIFLHLR